MNIERILVDSVDTDAVAYRGVAATYGTSAGFDIFVVAPNAATLKHAVTDLLQPGQDYDAKKAKAVCVLKADAVHSVRQPLDSLST